MKIQIKVATALVVAVSIGLYGCDSGEVAGSGNEIPAAIAAEPADELIRNSLLSFYGSADDSGGGTGVIETSNGVAAPAPQLGTADAGSSADSSGSRFSDTNVQEAGVDESDRIKIDGDVLYALETPDVGYVDYGAPVPIDFITTNTSVPYAPAIETLSAYKLDGDNSSVVSRLPLSSLRDRSVNGMYHYKNSTNSDLVLMSGPSFSMWDSWGNSVDFAGLETRLSWIDVNDPSAMATKRTMDIQGHLISSRRVGNRLILVTRFHPQIEGVNPYAYTEADRESNRNLISNVDASEFMPTISISENGDTTQRPVITDNQCYSSRTIGAAQSGESDADSSADSAIGYYASPSVVSIIAIDLDNFTAGVNSTCFVGDTETLYVSPQSVYLATTDYNYGFDDGLVGIAVDTVSTTRPVAPFFEPEIRTYIHKFSFAAAGAPVFKGSGSVTGHLGWNPDRKPFRFSEKDNNLRVVTFDQSRDVSPVTLSILQESNGSLATLSTLPNESRPDPIGKPGESLYASRFIGDKAYLVTFRVTDPLYVLDVSNPRDPRIAGELEIPGYSDYLHPVNDSLLIGLGKDAVPTPSNFGFGDGRGAWYQGVKLALYDVSDPANPFVADERVYGKRGTESPALLQHHSFAYLAGDTDRLARLAIPLSLNNEQLFGGAQGWADWSSNQLLTLEVDESINRFVDVPGWTLESREAGFQYSPIGLDRDRAVIGADDSLYLIHNGTLRYGQWGVGEPTLSISGQ